MLEMVIDGNRKDLGHGLVVSRMLPVIGKKMIGPFVFLDHMGPAQFAPGDGLDVRPHPHIGLSTVTFLFDGEFVHRDNLGYKQPIRPGELNWMTAGNGIVHSERTDPSLKSTGSFNNGLQAWVALPESEEESRPTFTHVSDVDLPTTDDGAVFMRLVAGAAYGLVSPAPTFSPLFYAHVELSEDAQVPMPIGHVERAAYVVAGNVEFDGTVYTEGKLLVFKAGGEPSLRAVAGPARLMLLGGEPLGQRFIWWNFVSSRKERIEQAKADWLAGRMSLPAEETEFIPLPAG